MQKYNIPKHLSKIGNLIAKGWKEIAERHKLKIKIMNIPSLITFKFDYGKKTQAIHTLFTQEMLKRGYLASKSVYVSYAHKEKHLKEYLENVDNVFGLIKKAIDRHKIYNLLKGPVAHKGFKRLT